MSYIQRAELSYQEDRRESPPVGRMIAVLVTWIKPNMDRVADQEMKNLIKGRNTILGSLKRARTLNLLGIALRMSSKHDPSESPDPQGSGGEAEWSS